MSVTMRGNRSAAPRPSVPGAVGVLGGGQLACMLADAAEGLGLPVTVLSDRHEPAARSRHPVIIGRTGDPATVARLATVARVIAWESENVDVGPVADAASCLGVAALPDPAVIADLQDKLRQKTLLAGLGIASAPFRACDHGAAPDRWAERTLAEFDGRCVFKWGRQGYDGRGVLVLRGAVGDVQRAVAFSREAHRRGVPLYAEALVPFAREVAIVAVRSVSGEFAAYPLVVSSQAGGVCDRVLGPATAFGVPAHVEAVARATARRIAKQLGLVGTFAVEFFELTSGALLVNEIAPRVHNSGHFTLDAAQTSQFENHWRALLGLPLGPTVSHRAFAMLNLLGPADADSASPPPPFPSLPPGAHLHWYGKDHVRPGRKMGHVNLAARDPETLVPLLAAVEHQRRAWAEACAAPSAASTAVAA